MWGGGENMYKRLKELRKNKKYNQTEIANILNITQSNYARIEKGIQDLSTIQLIKLAKLYEVETDYILELK